VPMFRNFIIFSKNNFILAKRKQFPRQKKDLPLLLTK